MFVIHQIVNVLINPVVVVLVVMAVGLIFSCRKRSRLGRGLVCAGAGLLFLMSWPPVVDILGIWLERDYPAVKADSHSSVDAIIVLGGGMYVPHPDARYPYPLMTDAADRVWHGARLWHAQMKRNAALEIKIYCSGPEVSACAPLLLVNLGVPKDAIVTFDDPLNTEQEAKQYGDALNGKTVLLVTSALHMKRSMMIFKKFAPEIKVLPAATDHQFFKDAPRFSRWQYYFPNVSALGLTTAIEHELIGIFRYVW